MAIRSTIRNQGAYGRPGTQSIIADLVTDADPAGAAPGDELVEITTGAIYLLSRLGLVNSWQKQNEPTPLASPRIFVASTGNDSAAGTLAAPLATLTEACRRLSVAGWTVEAFVITLDTLNLGANPNLNVPEPVGAALPVCFQTTYVTDFAGVVVTGGSLGTFASPIIGGTFVSAPVGGGVNAQRGKILSVTGGALAGTRYPIHADDGAGTLTMPGKLVSIPLAGATFDVLSRAGKWTWSGTFVLTGPVKILDGIELLPTGAAGTFLGQGVTQTSALRWLTVAPFTLAGREFVLLSCTINGFLIATGYAPGAKLDWTPTGLTPCGDRFDGAAGLITICNQFGGPNITATSSSFNFIQASMQGLNFVGIPNNFPVGLALVSSTMNDAGISTRIGTQVTIQSSRIESGRRAAGGTAILSFLRVAGGHFITGLTFVTPAAADDLIEVGNGSRLQAGGIDGVAAVGKLFLRIFNGATVINNGSNTATGGTAGADIAVDGGTGFVVALLATYGAIQSGVSGGTFASSTDNSATPAIANTVDKISGREALAAASGAVFTLTNALAKAADDCFLQLITRDATAVAPIAVVTDGVITITFLAAATGATKFAWWLKKSTV